MNTFFYFIPNRNTLTPADAAALGLAYAFEKGIDCAQVMNGPGGQNGLIAAQQDSYADGQLGYHPTEQIWQKLPNSDVYVGCYKNAKPTPADLVRPHPIAGPPITLKDGQAWQTPLARSYSERDAGETLELFWTNSLPHIPVFGEDGVWLPQEIDPDYARLWGVAEGWFRIRFAESDETDIGNFNYSGQMNAAVYCLAANYRLGPAEASLLRILNDELAIAILDALIDYENYLALIKKKLSRIQASALTPDGGFNSSAGPAASIATTDQPSPTSPSSPMD